MSSLKHKDVILDILTRSGRVLRSDLKDQVMRKMGLDNYPKQTFAYHIDKLVEEGKIKRDETDSNAETIYIPKNEHPVHGGLILQALKGRIHVPELLAGFDISLTDELPLSLKKDQFLFVFQFNSHTLCLKIPKAALPFKLHLSRKKFAEEIYPHVMKNYGARTITLELPITQLSSFPLTEPGSEKQGHFVLSFDDEGCTIKDLIATNPSDVAFVKDLSFDKFHNELTLFSDSTVDSKFEKRSSQIKGKSPLERNAELPLKLPVLILICSDSQLGIFSDK